MRNHKALVQKKAKIIIERDTVIEIIVNL